MRGALTCPPSSLPLKSFSSTGFHALICHLPLLSCELRLSCFSPWTGRQGASLRSHLSKRLTSQARAWEPGRTSQGAAAAAANRPLCSDFTAQKVAPDWALPRKAILKAQRVLGIYPAHWPARLPRKPSPDFWASARVWRGTGDPRGGLGVAGAGGVPPGLGRWVLAVPSDLQPVPAPPGRGFLGFPDAMALHQQGPAEPQLASGEAQRADKEGRVPGRPRGGRSLGAGRGVLLAPPARVGPRGRDNRRHFRPALRPSLLPPGWGGRALLETSSYRPAVPIVYRFYRSSVLPLMRFLSVEKGSAAARPGGPRDRESPAAVAPAPRRARAPQAPASPAAATRGRRPPAGSPPNAGRSPGGGTRSPRRARRSSPARGGDAPGPACPSPDSPAVSVPGRNCQRPPRTQLGGCVTSGQVLALPVPGFPTYGQRVRTAGVPKVSGSHPETPRMGLPRAGTNDSLQTALLLDFKIKRHSRVEGSPLIPKCTCSQRCDFCRYSVQAWDIMSRPTWRTQKTSVPW